MSSTAEPPMWDGRTWGDLKKLLKDVPDDAIIVGEFEDEFKFNEFGDVKILPAGEYVVRWDDGSAQSYEMPVAVLLYGGQVVNTEYALDDRYDLHILKVMPGE